MDHRHYYDHDGWWGVGWIVPLILLVILAVATAILVARLIAPKVAPPAPPLVAPTVAGHGAVATDPALAEARLRYASGQLDRESYLRIVRDLGGTIPDDHGEG